jgi:hypothetical protein
MRSGLNNEGTVAQSGAGLLQLRPRVADALASDHLLFKRPGAVSTQRKKSAPEPWWLTRKPRGFSIEMALFRSQSAMNSPRPFATITGMVWL